MIGREFCTLLSIDYDEIVKFRQGPEHQISNLRDFISDILHIKSTREEIERQLGGYIDF